MSISTLKNILKTGARVLSSAYLTSIPLHHVSHGPRILDGLQGAEAPAWASPTMCTERRKHVEVRKLKLILALDFFVDFWWGDS
jgi:hypothetical protein